ncbi:MAG: EAL domain-containing protein [Chloroflexota bacterium]|nr:EAL domain-containing protein [Chloroflexota bacterium]
MKKILIIEDDPDIRFITAICLRKQKFEVLEAENGQEGVKKAQQFLPDLIICDIAMPGMDGYTVLVRLQQEPVTTSIPFIFLTSFAARENFRHGMSLGADDFLEKPVSCQELLAAVEARLNRHESLTSGYTLLIEQTKRQVDYLKDHDSVTGLPNQNYLLKELDNWLVDPSCQAFTLFHFGIDCHLVQQTLGWEQGDLFLEAIIQRLNHYLKGYNYLLARLETERFVLILLGVNELEVVTRQGQALLQELGPPLTLNGQEIFVRANLGLSRYPQDGRDRNELLRKAEFALGQATKISNLTCYPYNQEPTSAGLDALTLQVALSHALERGELMVYYQPQLETQTGQLAGAEALLRWYNPVLGWVSPAQFIPLAEETGFIEPISRWVLQKVCRQNQIWQTKYGKPLRIAVNLPAEQFRQLDLIPFIEQTLQARQLTPDCLTLELTESMLVQDVAFSLATMQLLKKKGIKLSLDDFGTGYSSLSYLKRFPFDELKIDQSFIREVTITSRNRAIVASIIQLAHNLELKVVAEGVETQEQLTLLKQLECEEVQGYLIGRPASAAEIEAKFLVKLISASNSISQN